MHKKRGCYLHEKELVWKVPIFEFDDAGMPKQTGKYRIIKADINEFYKLLEEFSVLTPSEPLMKIVKIFFRDVCPKSILSMEDTIFLQAESFCSEYGCLPFEGAMADQPNFIIEIFNTIRGTRNEYEKIKQEEFKNKMNKQNKSSTGQSIQNVSR